MGSANDKMFLYCSKCGTRNFNDDIKCGVCNNTLLKENPNNYESNKGKSSSKIPEVIISVFILIVIAITYYGLKNESEPKKPFINDIGDFTNSNDLKNTNQVESNNYSIIKITRNNKFGFNVDVRISKKLLNKELLNLAKIIKAKISATSNIGVVFFLLPNMQVDNGAWAAVDFKPEINVRIIGQKIEDEKFVDKNILNKINDYYGLWEQEDFKGESIIRIRKDKLEGYVYEYIDPFNPKPNELASPLIKTTKNKLICFLDTELEGVYYIVEKNGDLSVYDSYGYVMTYKRLK